LAVEAALAHDSAKLLDTLQTNMQTPAHAAFVAQLAAKTRKERRSF
jgi:hypothetical protein